MDLTSPLYLLVNVVVFLGVFLPIYAIFRHPVPAEPPVHRRVAAAVGAERRTVFENPMLAPIMNLALMLAERFNVQTIRQRIRRDLEAAGNPSGYSVEEYLAICLLSGIGIAFVVAIFDLLVWGGGSVFLTAPAMGVIGFIVPAWALYDAAKRRLSRVSGQLPYTLDLISLVMQAGSTFPEAVETLIRDDPNDDLNQELRVALNEMSFGTTRAQALQNMADRIPLESLRSIVGAVNQAEDLGTPLASILKLQAEMLRMHRSVRAEKLAASASLRILVPSMLILMAVVAIVFAPLLIMYIQEGSLAF
jgi:tight adherence protein C